jgi:hypothetical protein
VATRRTTPKRPEDDGPEGPFALTHPGIVEAFSDFATSSAWEALRQFGHPATVAELTAILGRGEAAVQRTLDALEPIGVVRKLPASSKSPRIRYEVTRRKIVLLWDPADPAQRAVHRRLAGAFEARSAADLAKAGPYTDAPAVEGYIDRRMFWGHFTPADLKQVQAIVGMLDLLMARINARQAADAGPRRGGPAPAPLCNYHVSFAIAPIRAEVPALALIQAENRANTPYGERHRASVAYAELTARERQVFDLLMAGNSLAAIGSDLGISRATVATLAKHVYRKFAVRGRQQLVAATMGLGAGPAAKARRRGAHPGG